MSDKPIYKIASQSKPIINMAWIDIKRKGIALVGLDLKSKYCEVGAFVHGNDLPCLSIETTPASLYLLEGESLEDWTLVEFPAFKGWQIRVAEISKYTGYVCFTKEEQCPKK